MHTFPANFGRGSTSCGNARRFVSHALVGDAKSIVITTKFCLVIISIRSPFIPHRVYIHVISVSVPSTFRLIQSGTVCIFIEKQTQNLSQNAYVSQSRGHGRAHLQWYCNVADCTVLITSPPPYLSLPSQLPRTVRRRWCNCGSSAVRFV